MKHIIKKGIKYSYDDDEGGDGENGYLVVEETTECSQAWCTSPNGEGGYDCWATSWEPSTCSDGSPEQTGASTVSPTPVGCADGWTELEGSCFKFYTGFTDAPAAAAVCASAGGHLATIASAVQNAYAYALTDGGLTLIGLSHAATENGSADDDFDFTANEYGYVGF